MGSAGKTIKNAQKTSWRQTALKQWQGLIQRTLDTQRVTTMREARSFVEAMEPRYLLSGESLVIPPPQDPAYESMINLQAEAEAALVAEQSLSSSSEQNIQINEVIFVDRAVSDHLSLLSQALQLRADQGLESQYEVVYLDAQSDGIEQISQWLSQYQDLSAIHIISHGSSATLHLGNSTLNQESLSVYSEALRSWGESLASGADLLIYGCSVAAGEAGQAFVQALSELTQADVAASTDITGAEVLGGNWLLEKHTGSIETETLFAFGPIWDGVLNGPYVSTSANENFSGTSQADTFVFSDDWGWDSITAAGGLDTLDFRLVTGDLVFIISENSVTVRYAESARSAHELTYTATSGQSVNILGGSGDDQYIIENTSLVSLIDDHSGMDSVHFALTAGAASLTRSGQTTQVNADADALTLQGLETYTGNITLGAAVQNQLSSSLTEWSEVLDQFLADEVLATQLPLLDLSLAQAVSWGLGGNKLSVAEALDSIREQITIDLGSLEGLTNLQSISDQLQMQLNSGLDSAPFQVTAGMYNWSELRIDLYFDAAQHFSLQPSLSDTLTDRLAGIGLDLSAFSDLNVEARIGGAVSLGVRLDGFNTLDSGDFSQTGFLRVNPLTFAVDADVTGLTVTAGLSEQVFGAPVKAQVEEGSVQLRALATLSLNAANEINTQATASLDARFPLSAQLGSFDLTGVGTPVLILRTPDLIQYHADTDTWRLVEPEVFLDIRISDNLKASLLNVLETLDETGNSALSIQLLNLDIPGLDLSVIDLLGFDVDAEGKVQAFKLKAAAEAYFAQFDGISSEVPSLSGLTEALQALFARDFSLPFDTSRLDWSGFDFSGYNFSAFDLSALRNFDFSGANLSGADFQGLDLSGVNFSGANLSGARFSGALLRGVNFSGANLTGIDWHGVDLRALDFRGVNLSGANLAARDLSGINLSGANLSGADLSGANLRWANLIGTHLNGTNLTKAFALNVEWSSLLSRDLTFDSQTQLTGMLVDVNLRSLFGALAEGVKRLVSGVELSGYNWSG